MTVIRPNSIAGINSITAQSNTIGFFKSDGTTLGVTLTGISFGDVSTLSVTGVSTLSGGVNASQGADLARLRVTGISTLGQTNITGLSNAGLSTLGNVTSSTLVVSGVSTLSGGVNASEGVDLARLRVTGITTLGQANITGLSNAGVSTLGNATASTLVVSGVSTLSGGVNASQGADLARLRVTGITTLGQANITGLSNAGVSTLGNATASTLNVSGIVTATGGFNLGISSAGTTITSGPITTLNFVGTGNTFAVSGTTIDISISGGSGSSSGGDGSQFNTGITSTVVTSPIGIGTTVLTFPSTAGKRYLVYSIFASNVATGNTEVNIIGAFDFTSGYAGGQRSFFAYNIPIPTGTSIELLEQPQILNPSDRITVRSTDVNRNGADDIIKMFITYEEKASTDYFGIGINTVGLAVTTPVGIYTSSTNPSIVQSIRLVNRTDDGPYPITVDITSGVVTTKLVDNLIIPKYGSVELLTQPKRLLTNDVIKVTVDQASTIDVQVSGKQIV